MSRSGSVTIYDIAKSANVSYATVSRVLNGKPDVNEETRRRVQEIISETGYRPEASARGLSSNKTWLIGVFAGAKFSNAFFSEVIAEFRQTVETQGFDIVFFRNDEAVALATASASINRRLVDGVLVAGMHGYEEWRRTLVGTSVPIVTINFDLDLPNSMSIESGNYSGSWAAIEHLYRLGHRRIGIISETEPQAEASRQRLKAYKDFLDSTGQGIDQDLIVTIGFADFHAEVELGRRAAVQLLDQSNPPTAIMCLWDVPAIGVLIAANQRNLNVPEDLSVVGFDDIDIARYLSPPLTTVRQDRGRMGKAAAQVLLQRISGEPVNGTDTHQLLLPTELIVRLSTGKPQVVCTT